MRSIPAALAEGHIFRPVIRGDRVAGERLGEKVVWQMLRRYADAAGVPGIAPHDARRYAESRIMPNRCEGHSFGVALQINAAALIRHNPKESETIQKEQQVFIRLIADRTLALIGVVLERTFCKNRCSVLVFGLVEIVADGTVGSRSRLSAPREAGSPTDGHPPVYPDYAESFTAACTAGAAPLSPFGIIRDSA